MAKRQRYPTEENKSSKFFMKRMVPKSDTQDYLYNTLKESTITLCTGPAGTGKTYVAIGVALEMLMENKIDKIIVTKPILEAGDEKIGFLPGDVDLKILPHMEYIIDKIEELVGVAICEKLIKNKQIIFSPTAYLRGRDFKYSFILIDEAQNMTKNGLKLLMTRLGEGSIMSISGDSDQIDLKVRSDSGLDWCVSKLEGRHSQISVVKFSNSDICRHPLITDILNLLQ